MNRRKALTTLAAVTAVPMAAAPAPKPIQLHVELEVAPAKEKELIATFHKVFAPTITKQPGFVSVRLLKFRQAIGGSQPPAFKHRLCIAFQTEEQRLAWVASADHQRVWPEMDKSLQGARAVPILYDQL